MDPESWTNATSYRIRYRYRNCRFLYRIYLSHTGYSRAVRAALQSSAALRSTRMHASGHTVFDKRCQWRLERQLRSRGRVATASNCLSLTNFFRYDIEWLLVATLNVCIELFKVMLTNVLSADVPAVTQDPPADPSRSNERLRQSLEWFTEGADVRCLTCPPLFTWCQPV